jgi:hypothetical protein
MQGQQPRPTAILISPPSGLPVHQVSPAGAVRTADNKPPPNVIIVTSLYTVRLRRHAVRSTIDSGEGIGRPKPNPLTHQGPVCSDPPPGQLPVVSN